MADKELAKLRRNFVERASVDLIKQLLDDLLDDQIVNDGESDSILEMNITRTDRARSLIDTVKRKGDAASRKMIEHLQSRDQTLYAELRLSSGLTDLPAAPPAAPLAAPPAAPLAAPPAAPPEPQMEQKWSATLVPTTKSFWSEKKDDRNIYPVTNNSYRNRVALLITNITFTDKRLNRKGAEKDEENMEKLLTDLGYEVVKHTNLTGKAIEDAIIEFSKHPKLKETDSVLVVIMSHGKLGAVLGVNYKEEKPDEFPINNIYKHLGSEKCSALLNKPKIIIIQACRGDEAGSVLVSDGAALVCDVQQLDPAMSAEEDNIEDDCLQYVHKEKDFISFLSSTPDTVSYRQMDRGSFLIQYFVEVGNNFACKDDIEELFRKVMQRFEDFGIQKKRQMPTKDRCSLTKRFYFYPGVF